MQKLTFLLACCLAFLLACESSAPKESPETETVAADTNTLQPETFIQESNRATSPPCPTPGKVLQGNQLYDAESNHWIVIRADSSTYDANLGDSHRILEIYEAGTCNLLFQQVLPINESPDFPYYLSQFIYNKVSRLVGIRGDKLVYFFDLSSNKLSPAMKPKFVQQRYAADAQSGRILHLETWEQYLVGYARDYGAFVFDLRNSARPMAMLPSMEYQLPDDSYSSVFLLPSGQEQLRQVLLPYYDYQQRQFQLNAMLQQPQELSLQNSRDQRFLLIDFPQDEQKAKLAVDLKTRKSTELDAQRANQPASQVFEWMKTNE